MQREVTRRINDENIVSYLGSIIIFQFLKPSFMSIEKTLIYD